MSELKPKVYKKHNSFDNISSRIKEAVEYQKMRSIRVLRDYHDGKIPIQHSIKNKANFTGILKRVESDLTSEIKDPSHSQFEISPFAAEEMYTYSDEELIRFFYHRYRYEIFPQNFELDNYPPALQIEPSSLCNYRCVFCYQTDSNFFKKTNPSMSMMSFEFFKEIVDEINGEIEFVTLASRGEPLMAPDISKILEYSNGKFLNLKLNTNASLLTESKIHSLLSGSVKTLVFSADAAEEPLYSQLRVNGKLDKVLKNIELFRTIREKSYPNTKIITRVSGVKVTEKQDMVSMEKVWGGLVDQIAFVNYNPWENIYESSANGQTKPCSDLYRRMFVWADGTTNPCDSDYKSELNVGKFPDLNISELWQMRKYTNLREAHKSGNRQLVHPCKGCAVV
ncbi:radical SAM protein [Leptospira levettii]|uniref:radical SAM/SPASM domain-containing protein n=1 Tax=Leptospira levettii TaxID=2023178 RepID=UPI000C2A2DCC|nr:radical SAM/SPASM domain-containing protein [Leptospira levettii]MCW7472039.1 radical SAM protein [Leptospira levettii]PJZ36169.1 radical SAM protein [Leptospira levettii]PJZ90155.1 radical SAM protein [Leptospira levettii]PJZ99859.1 radical SAM protein [Leptospira levettii]